VNRRLLAVSLSLVVLLTVTQVPAQGAPFLIRAQRSGTVFVFSPMAPHVAVRTMVTWRSLAGTHTVTATSPNWSKNSNLTPASPTSFTFRRKGTYRYRCLIHSSVATGRCTGMCGRVIVP